MTTGSTQRVATVGVAEHGHSAVLVTVAPGGELLDRRRIDLTRGLPTHPYHHEGSWAVGRYRSSPWAREMSLADAVALVERVREAAARGARDGLDALVAAVPVPIVGIAIRVCPTLPPTIVERIADPRAQTVADGVMYREALATAAEARRWNVHWYERERVFRDAALAIGREDVDAFLQRVGPIDRATLAGRTQACGGRGTCRRRPARAARTQGSAVSLERQVMRLRYVLIGTLIAPVLAAAQGHLGTHEDRIAVEDVMARYVWAVDSLDAEAYVAVFTDDAVIDSNGAISRGRAAIRQIVTNLIRRRDDNKAKGAPTSNLYHVISNVRITFPRPDEALHQSYWQTVRRQEGRMNAVAMGRSEDRLVKREGRWLIQSRTLTVFTD